MTEPTMDKIREIARGAKSIDEIEQRSLKAFGTVPDELLDPVKSAELFAEISGQKVGEAMGQKTIDMHLNQFEQAYEGRVDNPEATGWARNIAGQGQPGTEAWLKAKRETRQPAKEVPPTTKG